MRGSNARPIDRGVLESQLQLATGCAHRLAARGNHDPGGHGLASEPGKLGVLAPGRRHQQVVPLWSMTQMHSSTGSSVMLVAAIARTRAT